MVFQGSVPQKKKNQHPYRIMLLSVCSSVKIILTLIDLRLIKIALSEIQIYRPLEHRTIQIKEKIGKVKFISYLLAPFILNMYKYWRI